MEYASSRVVESQKAAGVRFTVRRMSFGRRMKLMRSYAEQPLDHAVEARAGDMHGVEQVEIDCPVHGLPVPAVARHEGGGYRV